MQNGPIQYQIKEARGMRYLWVAGPGKGIETLQDGLDLIGVCFQENVNRLMIGGERLSADFGRLATGLAGAVAEKLGQYRIKTVLVLDPGQAKGKFSEFLAETNRGGAFRAYPRVEEAESWLLGED